MASEASMAATPSVLAELKALGAGRNTEVLFACGGSVKADKPVRVHYSTSPKAADEDVGKQEGSEAPAVSMDVVEFPFDPELNVAAMDRFLDACAPATFGKGRETVLDSTYRSAFMLPADRWMSSFQLSDYPIMSEIHALLAPNAANIRAHPYKINVYKEGGFFKSHTDTPRDGNTFGTLVVCLPSPFGGGDFEVEHDGVKHVFAWGPAASECAGRSDADAPATETEAKPAASGTTDAPTIQWCAFYADCSHKVETVTAGYRVTMTYLLENDQTIPRAVTSATKTSPFVVKLAKLLEMERARAARAKRLGFALEHKYTVDARGTVPMLKGFDRFVKAALDTLKLEYEFVPVFLAMPSVKRNNLYRRLIKQKGPAAADVHRYEVYASRWAVVTSMDDEDADGNEYSKDYLQSSVLQAEKVKGLRWVVPPTALHVQFHTAMNGNEASVNSYYAAAAFLVKV